MMRAIIFIFRSCRAVGKIDYLDVVFHPLAASQIFFGPYK